MKWKIIFRINVPIEKVILETSNDLKTVVERVAIEYLIIILSENPWQTGTAPPRIRHILPKVS